MAKGGDDIVKRIRIVIGMLVAIMCLSSTGISLASEIQTDVPDVSCDTVMVTEDIFIGIWKDTSNGCCGNMHNFYRDGGYRYYYRKDWDALDNRWYLEGTWTLQDNEIIISIASLFIYEKGTLKHDEWTGYWFEDGEVVLYHVDPCLEKRYNVSSLRMEKGDDSDVLFGYDEQLTVDFGGVKVRKFDDYPFPRNAEEEAESMKRPYGE